MVTVNVAQLLKSLPGAKRELRFSEELPDPTDDLHLQGPVVGQLTVLRTSRGILVESVHRARCTLECSRCLDEVSVDVESSFAEEFAPTVELHSGLPVQDDADDDLLRIDDHHEIDLDDLLRQSILTSLPFQPLCNPNCPGLCATCGQRLDQQHPPHAESAEVAPAADTRRALAGLADLLRPRDDAPGSGDS